VALLIYFDEDFADGTRYHALASAGYDVETPAQAGMLARSDRDQLRYSTAQGRLLLSHNLGHFHAIHAEVLAAGESHGGICLLRRRFNYSPGEIRRRLDILSERYVNAGTTNQLLFLSNFG
jgi:hypothetical protein